MGEKFADKIRVPIFEPRKAPVRGMSSFVDACALDPGWYVLLQNVRTDKGTIRVRDGHAKLTSTAINSGTGTFGGAGVVNYQGFWSGNPIIAAGVEVSSAGRVYISNTGTSFTEVTAASGQYGDTRFGTLASGDGRIYFNSGFDRLTNDSVVIAQNGTADPRVYSITDALTSGHYTPTPPAKFPTARSKPTFPAFFTVKDGTTTTLSTPTGTSVAFADTSGASTTENSLTLTCTNPTNGNQALCVFSAGISFSSSRQLVIIANSNATNFTLWKNVKIELGDSGGFVTVYDPTAAANSAYGIHELTSNGENYVLGFSIDAHTGSSSNPNIASCDRVRVTWVGSTLSATTFAVTIYVIAASGLVPGNALHCYCYGNSVSKALSVPQFITDVRGESITNLGGIATSALTCGNGSQIFYNYVVGFLHTSTAERNLGTNKLYLFRQDEDDSDYFYVSTTTIATYSAPNWSFSNHGSTSALGLCSLTDSTLAKNYLIRAPDAENINIPIGTMMIEANARMFVCKSTSGVSKDLYISDHRYQFRFRESPKLLDDGTIDPVSGTVYPFSGERLLALKSSSVGYGGQSFVYLFTDQSVYMIPPNVHQIQKVASFGTQSPESIAEYKGTIVFLDSDRKVQVIENGAIRDISDRLVEDILKAIPTTAATTSRISRVSAEIFGGQYHLSYSPNGATTNTRRLVYDFDEQKWYDDLEAGSVTGEALMVWSAAGKFKLVTIANNLHLYEMETSGQTTDDGTIPTISIKTGEFKLEEWHKFAIGRVGVVCDDVTSGAIAVSRAYSPGTGSASTSSISVDVSTDEAWKYDGAITLGDANGYRGQLTLTSSTLPGGTHIREIVAELHPRRSGVSV